MRLPAFISEAPTIAEAMARRRDNFALLRLILALAVVVSHAFSVTTGFVEGEPLVASTGFTLGEHAVNGFFAISGFLVTMSFAQRGARDYVVARGLRIAPGLIAATLACALLLGSLLTRLPLGAYLSDAGTWRFVSATLTTLKSNGTLPGVFEANPFKFPMGTVWTLKYEVLCYIGVLALGLAGALGKRWFGLVLVVALALGIAGLDFARADAPKGMQTALRLPFIFAAGGALYVWRERIRLSPAIAIALVVAAALGHGTALFKALMFAAEAYGVIVLALAPALSLSRLEPQADLSYGTYLYGWPVQQALHALAPAIGPLALLAPSVALTLGVAALSWFMVEKPALALKARILAGRRFRPVPAATL
jgi:peptidoglycan/LPS O-acetylase OafA/YrhL